MFLIADHTQGTDTLQVLLFQLQAEEWETPSTASNRMKAIATALAKRPSNFLLLAANPEYDRLMLVNPRQSFDQKMNIKVNIRKLLIDRTNPTAYDRDRLEAIAARKLSPTELFKVQCEAFNVERLTKEFYRNYKVVFEQVQATVRQWNSDPYFEDEDRLHQFSQRLLGRIMFLYFLQKKEFLGEDKRFLSQQYRLLKSEPDETDYYAEILEPLFFETLNQPRPNLESRWGKIPYLNGGLFDRDYGVGIRDAAGRDTPDQIQLPNSLFDPGYQGSILNFFNGYNFTISENVQGDEDVAVDPEMLGKVFENMLAAEERGQSGTFYTPRGIVQFMCESLLCRYLADQSGMTAEDVQALIELDPDTPDAEFNKRLSREQAKQLKAAVERVKVLDPAVGSGAFPLGMMQTILAVRQAIARREGMTVQRGSLAISQWKRDIIANNLYGVDIKPEAIEIAKLRMWLSLVVDIPHIEDVEPLPNLDYKLMCGDSLISTINGEHIIPDPRKESQQLTLMVSPLQAEIQALIRLEEQFYEASAEDRKALRGKILEAEQSVFKTAIAERRESLVDRGKQVAQKISQLKRPPKVLKDEQTHIAESIEALDQFEQDVLSGERSLTFFQYHLHFRDVFEQGGFDVVIGNPPYVRMEKMQEAYKKELKIEFPDLFTGRADIYTYFYGKGIEILRQGGHLGFVTSNKWFRAKYGKPLRQFLAAECQIINITDFGELPVFDAATFPMIFLAQKGDIQHITTRFTQVGSLEPPYPDIHALIQSGENLPDNTFSGDSWMLIGTKLAKCLDKMKSAGIPLEDYVDGDIYYGIKTGFNQAFFIDQKTKDELILADPRSAEFIKPLAVGDDIRKWRIKDINKWLIYTYHGIYLHNNSPIIKLLEPYRSRLQKRATNQKWYELQQPQFRYAQEFPRPKIIYPIIAKEPRFAFDESGTYVNDKVFVIPRSDYFLLGIINSFWIWEYLKNLCSSLGDANQGGRLELRAIYVSQIPVPLAIEEDKQAISTLVQKCLDAKGQGVEQWEAEIDERVARLYGLTEEDMKIIRGEA